MVDKLLPAGSVEALLRAVVVAPDAVELLGVGNITVSGTPPVELTAAPDVAIGRTL